MYHGALINPISQSSWKSILIKLCDFLNAMKPRVIYIEKGQTDRTLLDSTDKAIYLLVRYLLNYEHNCEY